VRNGSVDLETADNHHLVPTFSVGLGYLF